MAQGNIRKVLGWAGPVVAIGAAFAVYLGIQAIRPVPLTSTDTAALSTAPEPQTAALLDSLPSRAATPDLTAPPALGAAAQPVPAAVSITEPTPTPQPAEAATPMFAPSPASGDPACLADLRQLASEARIYFPSGGLSGDDQGMAQARLIGLIAQECPGVTVVVQGHSDPSGDPAINLQLSQQRAQTVIDRLAAGGLTTASFRAQGMGDQFPSTIRGEQDSAYYDRRVEFVILHSNASAAISPDSPGNGLPGTGLSPVTLPACALPLQRQAADLHVQYRPRSVTVSQGDLGAVTQLAAAIASCPGARLRVIGQFDDQPGSGETPATARMRAIAMMSTLVAMGFDDSMIIMAAPSRPTALTNASVGNRRLDFDLIYTDE